MAVRVGATQRAQTSGRLEPPKRMRLQLQVAKCGRRPNADACQRFIISFYSKWPTHRVPVFEALESVFDKSARLARCTVVLALGPRQVVILAPKRDNDVLCALEAFVRQRFMLFVE